MGYIESIVLTEFIVAARVNPIFRPVTEQMAADMRQVITRARMFSVFCGSCAPSAPTGSGPVEPDPGRSCGGGTG